MVQLPSIKNPTRPASQRISLQLAAAALVSQFFLFGGTPSVSGQAIVLTNLAQLRSVPLSDATNNMPVNVRVTITYIDPDWRMMFVQDAFGSAYVERNVPSGDATWNLQLGEVIDLKGNTSRGLIQCNIKEKELHPIRQEPLPKPVLLDTEDSFKLVGDARWVKTTGVITGVKTFATKLFLDLRVNPSRSIRLIVAQGNPVSAATLIGSIADVSGVYGLDLDTSNHPTGKTVIWINDLAWIEGIKALPITPIASLAVPTARPLSAQMVRIRGNVISQGPGNDVVRDDTGSVRVNCSGLLFAVGSPVEVYGYTASQENALVLNDATVVMPSLQSGARAALSAAAIPFAANTSLPSLRQIVQIRNLPVSEAARGYPVLVTGVLTFSDPQNGIQFIQDGSSGIYIDLKRKKFDALPAAPQLVEITGFTGPGEYAPVIEAEQLRVLGKTALPRPKFTAMQDLMTGAQDSQWVALNGIVRSQTVAGDTTTMRIAVGNSMVDVVVPNAGEHPAPRSFVDALVEIRGVCATVFDNQRHLLGINLDVPNWDEVRVLSVGTEDPFSLPVQSLNKLLDFHAGGESLHLAHVRGIVTLRQTDGSFYLQDAGGGVLVQTQTNSSLVTPGHALDVIGFPSIVNKWPVLQESLARAAAVNLALKPTSLSPETLLSQIVNGTLVHFRARVISRSSSASADSLTLQFGPWITDAILEKQQPDEKLGDIDSGSTVELTGVYLARLDDNLNVQSFQLLLRSPDDLRILTQPSWWTARRVFWSIFVLVTALALVLAWVTLLHRQVNKQTQALRSEIEERKRMELQVAATHKELLIASRGAGMAEVATSVLHNVGNVLNSVNVSANLVVETTKDPTHTAMARVSQLIQEHADDLPVFLTQDPKGQQLPKYLELQAERHLAVQQTVRDELESLTRNINHIKEIVARQQSYAMRIGVTEVLQVAELIEDALHMNTGALTRHNVTVVRDFAPNLPSISVDKHNVLQILVNLISNAKCACHESNRPDKRLTVRTLRHGDRVRISVTDNGVGITPENMSRIFNFGFTTREGGHGYGLHSGALAARTLGGTLEVQSEGSGQGATFVLELPLQSA